MISIPDSLSFAKLVRISSAGAKSAGDARYASQVHSFVDRSIVPISVRSASFLRRKQLSIIPVNQSSRIFQ